MSTADAAPDRRALRRDLLAWYLEHKRDLPWRRTRDPYAIWISETMLQQTRVETVIPYYERFLARFPTVEALADADADTLMEHWAGLGYYSRARNLHAAAKTIARELGGRVPDTVEGLRALKGIGPYTAGAVASIAFDRPAPIVDGNVARVFARVFRIEDDVKGKAGQARLWDEAEALAEGPSPGDLNQAIMELGALLCSPRAPRCLVCPIQRHCRASNEADPEALPVKAKKKAPKPVQGAAVWLERGGKVLVVRRPPEGLLGGLWELPGGDLESGETPEAGVARQVREQLGLEVEELSSCGSVRHVFTHRVLELHVFRGLGGEGRVRRRGPDAHRWLGGDAAAALPLSKVARKALDRARNADA